MQGITVNETRIAFIDEGRGATLLLLHGLGGSHDDWRLQRPEFAVRHRVIVPDLRGFGTSERRGPYTIRQHARDMIALLAVRDAVPAHVVGLSMGGAVAIEMALQAPASVASLVLANTAPAFVLSDWQRRRMAWQRFAIAAFLGVEGVARLLGQKVFPARHQGALRRRLIRHARGTSRFVYLASLRALTRWSAVSRLPSLGMPILVLGAQHDLTTSVEKRRWTARMPDARFVEIPGSWHHSELDSPARFNREVLDFVKPRAD